jgi:hypothetical protein
MRFLGKIRADVPLYENSMSSNYEKSGRVYGGVTGLRTQANLKDLGKPQGQRMRNYKLSMSRKNTTKHYHQCSENYAVFTCKAV